ncbi:MAG: hypothetical protein GY816_02985 [Cytophagales bacterium]|nr:hypothetical protein [Cytophagales bacterium]
MNKQKFIDYLRSPESLTEGQLEDLNKSLTDFPYFSIGRSIAARASKDLSHSSKGVLTATAAIYATDRKHLKKYINGELVFLIDVPVVQEQIEKVDSKEESTGLTEAKQSKEAESPEKSEVEEVSKEGTPDTEIKSKDSTEQAPDKDTEPEPTPKPTTPADSIESNDLNLDNLKAPTGDEVDQMLDELQHDMSELKKSRGYFVEIQNQIEEEEAVSAALRRATLKVEDLDVRGVKPSDPKAEEVKKPEPEAKKSETEKVKPETKKSKKETKLEDAIDKEDVKEVKKAGQKNKESELGEVVSKSSVDKPEKTKPTIKELTKAASSAMEDGEKAPVSKKEAKPIKAGIVTNFEIENPDEDNEIEPILPKAKPKETAIGKKEGKPARAARRKLTKIKRSELDAVLGPSAIKTNAPASKKTTDPKDSASEKKTKMPEVAKVEEVKKEAESKKEKETKTKASTATKPSQKKEQEKKAPAKTVDSKKDGEKKLSTKTGVSKTKVEEKAEKVEKTSAKTEIGKKEKETSAKTEVEPAEKSKDISEDIQFLIDNDISGVSPDADEIEKASAKTKVEPTEKSKVISENIQSLIDNEISGVVPDTDKKKSPIKKSADKKVEEEPQEESKSEKKEEAPIRSSARAFLDFGNTGMGTSISKASPSKRKRKLSKSKSSTRATKPASKSTDSPKKGGKDDDESGGTNQLIDKFIKESPSIKRRPEADNTSDLSEESSTWNPNLVSEYLAQISLDQGNTKRAISIYEALSLKFPEKKSYFAGLIKKINK